jgi:integrase
MGIYYVAKREPSPWAASFFAEKDGRRVRRISYHPTKRAASDAFAAATVEVKERTYRGPREAVTFDVLCQRFLASKRADARPGTVEGYEGIVAMYLRPFFGSRRVRDLVRADVDALKTALLTSPPPAVVAARIARYVAAYGADEIRWRARAVKPVGRRTVAAALALLSSLFAYAIDARETTHNPAAAVKKRSTTSRPMDPARVLTVAEARRLIEATTARHRTLIRFAVETGLRQAELFGLQWGDVDLAAGLVRVRRQWKRGAFADLKTTNSQRTVPLTPGLVSELKRWRLACPNGDLDLVFPNDEGRALCASNFLHRVFYPAFAKAGFERAELTRSRFRFHDLRHTFATQALAAGIAPAEVSRYLGHSSIVVTLTVYAHVLPDGHDAARAKLVGLYDGVRARSESETGVKQLARPGA